MSSKSKKISPFLFGIQNKKIHSGAFSQNGRKTAAAGN